ncbi:hypothetical protein BpHYR1_019659 [Brachionus plicatilis]|uniref:Uncharacterized protein n=1 Tax=Brachionus plicatilis TaxID=10195 RepID=A0A3M7SPG6_BRAPC|nr:hypothetical protein BpHYR1_019659 [Brachionus plicatilis]
MKTRIPYCRRKMSSRGRLEHVQKKSFKTGEKKKQKEKKKKTDVVEFVKFQNLKYVPIKYLSSTTSLFQQIISKKLNISLY